VSAFSEREHRAALWAYWVLAFKERWPAFLNARRGKESLSNQEEFDVRDTEANRKVERFCTDARPFIDPSDETLPTQSKASCGFSPSRRAYWIYTRASGNDAYKSGFGKAAGLDECFGEGASVPKTLQGFLGTETFSEIAAGGRVPTVLLGEQEQRVLKVILGKVPSSVPFLGAWMVGRTYGRYFLGARRFASAAKRSERDIAALLQYPEAIVERAKVTPSPAWFNETERARAASMLAAEPRVLSEVCRALVPSAERVIVSESPARGAAQEIVAKLQEAEHRVGGAPEHIALVSRSAEDQFEVVVHEALGQCAWPRLKVTVLDAQSAVVGLARTPWLWSKHFGSARGFQLVRNDPARLVDLFISIESRREIFYDHEHPAPVHPVLDEVIELARGSRVLITGRPGTGKTTALLQLLRACTDDHLVVYIEPTCSAEDWSLCERIINDTPHRGTWVFVIDDLDSALKINDRVTKSVGRLLATLGASACLLASCENHGLPGALDFEDGFTRVLLDNPPPAFEIAVLDAYNRDGEKLTARDYPAMVAMLNRHASALRGDTSIGSLIDLWVSNRYMPSHDTAQHARVGRSRVNREDVLKLQHRPAERAVIRTLVTLDTLYTARAGVAFVRAYAIEYLRQTGDGVGGVDDAIESLRMAGSITMTDGVIDCHDAAAGGRQGDEIIKQIPSLVRWTANHGRYLDPVAAATVLYYGNAYLDDHETVPIARLLLLEFPDLDERLLCGTMTTLLEARMRAGNPREYLKDVRDALRAQNNSREVVERLEWQLEDEQYQDVLGGRAMLEELVIQTELPVDRQAAVLSWLLTWHAGARRIIEAVAARTPDERDRETLRTVRPAEIFTIGEK